VDVAGVAALGVADEVDGVAAVDGGGIFA